MLSFLVAPIRDKTDDIRSILAEASQHAYEQGWNDCLEAFRLAAKSPTAPEPKVYTSAVTMADLFGRGGRPNTSSARVWNTIADNPGETGVQIALRCPDIHERTVRTALRRLRIAGKIEQREGKWFAVSSAAAAA